MRLKDAIGSLQLGRKKEPVIQELCTVWTEAADDGPEAVPLPEHPSPQMRRADWTNLNGWWDYGICPAKEAGKASRGEADGKILVPFSPESMRSGAGRTLRPGEILWYRRVIDSIDLPEGRRLLLHFGAVDERCAVYWNGHKAGTHRNGYLAFTIDVTEYVLPGANELKVYVRDDTDEGHECRGKQTLSPGGMFYHAQSGIWQTVWMETVPENYVKDLRITPIPEEEAVELEFTFAGELEEGQEIRITVGNPGTEEVSSEDLKRAAAACRSLRSKWRQTSRQRPQRRAKLVAPVADAADALLTAESAFAFPMESSTRVRLPIPKPRLWSPESPTLYPLHIETGTGEGTDVIESYFAMRSFGTGPDEDGIPRLLLNGEPYFFNGILDQGYWPETLMTPPADEALVFDIAQMKELGFNMLRKHVKIEPARWYYHCDRLGMVVWQDMVNGGGPVQKLLETYLPTIFPAIGTHLNDDHYKLFAREDEKARMRFERDVTRMIRQLYNCPCIGLWVPFNEGWGQFDALRITENMRREDPTRPIDHASGWFDQGGGDVRSVHNYFRPLTVEEDKLGRAFAITEYGGTNCQIAEHSMSGEVYGYSNVTAEEFPQSFADLMEKVRSLVPDGLCAAVYTQVSDIEEETNGLLTYDRKVRKV